MTARYKAYILLVATALIWGLATPIIKHTLQGFEADIFLLYRFAISSVLFIVVLLISRQAFPKSLGAISYLILYSIINIASLSFLFFGMEKTTAIEATLITLLGPLLTSIAGVRLLNEHVTTREKIGISIAMVGTAFTIFEPYMENGGQNMEIFGNFLVLIYVALTVINAIVAKKLLRQDVNPFILSNFSFVIGFFVFALYIFGLKAIDLSQIITELKNANTVSHLGVVYMALISGSLAYFLYNKAQKTIEVGEQAVFSYLNPIFAIPVSILWLKEEITPIYIIGAIIIAIGVVIAETKKKRYNP